MWEQKKLRQKKFLDIGSWIPFCKFLLLVAERRQRKFWENFTQRRQDISKVEIEDLIRTLMLINSRPRKCLNYTTSFEKFLYEIKF